MSKFGDPMRGLTVFISDIRACKSKEAERKRINKELGNIRSKFKNNKLDGYQKKKYVCKLVFIFLLGKEVDFGYQEAVNLLSSVKFSEKQIGYLFVSVMIGEGNDLLQLIHQAIKHDLESRNPIFISLAMQCIANVASRDMADQLGKEIPPLMVSHDTTPGVKQTASLCLLRLLRANPKALSIDQYASKMFQLLNDRHLGVVTSVCSLLEELAHLNPIGFSDCVSTCVTRLSRLVASSHSDLQDYSYYFVPAPWLCVKLMKLLQCFDIPDDAIVRTRLTEALDAILNRAQEPTKSKKVQHSNAKNAVLFESINLILHFDGDRSLQVRACNLLGGYLTHKETNMRYLALESLSHLASSELSHEAVKKHQDTVVKALSTERDVSVRQKAIDLLYAMCDHTNAETIVSEMLLYLEKADYSVRETLVLKVAILAEKYAQDYAWYVDTILKLIRLAGDYVSEEVWYRIIQIVVNKQSVQGYAAKTCFEALQAPACHENMIKVGGYILGEFGNLIAGDERSSPMIQFQLLHSKFHLCSIPTRAILLSTYMKFINLFPEIKPQIQQVLSADNQARNADAELQQRAMEYLKLSSIASSDVLATVLEEMPPFPDRDSTLLSKLLKTAPWTAKLHEGGGGGGEGRGEGGGEGEGRRERGGAVSNGPLAAISAPQETTPLQTTPILAPAQPVAQAPPTSDLLIDVFETISSEPPPTNTSAGANNNNMVSGTASAPASKVADSEYKKFLFKNSGVLYEDELLQIGVKSEFKKTLGRVGVFYGNKSSSALLNFSANLPDDSNELNLQVKPVGGTIEAGDQVQQIINVECKQPFLQPPQLTISFSIGGMPRSILLDIPVMLNKFLEPITLEAAEFFQRWKQLGSTYQESQKVFEALFPMVKEDVSQKLLSYGLSVLPGIDPNADNYVSSGVMNSRSQLVGCLVRLEPNLQTKMYRLTVRASQESVAKEICGVLSEHF